MGGNDYFERPAKNANEAEVSFKQSLDEVKEVTSEPKVRNVFISFAMEDENMINLLRSQGKNPNLNFYFRDYSVKEPFDEKWKAGVREKIAQTSVVFVMVSEYSASSEPVNWEVEEAYRQGKKVIAVRLHSDRNDPLPPAVRAHDTPVIDWNLERMNKLMQED